MHLSPSFTRRMEQLRQRGSLYVAEFFLILYTGAITFSAVIIGFLLQSPDKNGIKSSHLSHSVGVWLFRISLPIFIISLVAIYALDRFNGHKPIWPHR